jgi:hypothetical protein
MRRASLDLEDDKVRGTGTSHGSAVDLRLDDKRIFRLMRLSSLLLQPHTGRRPIRAHEGTVVAPASNQRWASDGLEIPCWNGEVVRIAFVSTAEEYWSTRRSKIGSAGSRRLSLVTATGLRLVSDGVARQRSAAAFCSAPDDSFRRSSPGCGRGG